MPQFFVPRKNISKNSLLFEPSESHHLSKVLRKKSGEIVQVFDGEGFVSHVKISDISNPREVKAEIISFQETVARRVNAKIYPALLKGERFEWMLEKLTELGVCSIHPTFSERTIVSIKPQEAGHKLERWKKIILASAKQCGRTDLPVIFPPEQFLRLVRGINKDEKNLILWEGEEKNLLSSFMRSSGFSTLSPGLNSVGLFVGPEGGFGLHEVDEAKRAGIIPASLGSAILRAETAAIAAVSLILLS